MQTIHIGDQEISRFILGSNPFSGFSHQGREMDAAMIRHYTTARIKGVFREAEQLGVRTLIGRTDLHVLRLLREYWDEGGTLTWFAQTCPGVAGTVQCMRRALSVGAPACHIHGGVADHACINDQMDELRRGIDFGHEHGLLVGMAGHMTRTFEWAEEHGLELDYYMCCYYNPIQRDKAPEHRSGTRETYLAEDRQAMVGLIQALPRPVIHYKVLAAGRNDPAEALAFAAAHMRPQDAVCVGIYNEHKPEMLREDVGLLNAALAAASA